VEISKTPIVKFYKNCLDATKEDGYKWVFCLLARESDIDGLYDNLKQDWNSLDSVTGDDFLFIVAGCRDSSMRFDDVIKIIIDNESKKEALKCLINSVLKISKNQTYAINDLKKYLQISESEIPCIAVTSLYSRHTYRVGITQNEIYRYIHDLVIAIDTHFEKLRLLEKYKSYDEVNDFMHNVIKTVDSGFNDISLKHNDKNGNVVIKNVNYFTNTQNSSIHIDQRRSTENNELINLVSTFLQGKFSNIPYRENEELMNILSEIKNELQQSNIDKRKTSKLFNKLKSGTELGAAMVTIFQALAPSIFQLINYL